jgi:hypothetical protein
MLFQVRKDQGSSTHSALGVSFHSGMDFSLLLASAFLWAFGFICLFGATPREGALLAAITAFSIAVIFLFFGGLTTQLQFRRDLRRMDVNWRIFSFDLISHSHPFSEISIGIRAPAIVSGSGRVSRIQRVFYSADIGRSHYLLGYPGDVPVDDAQLQVVRKDLGLLDLSPAQEQSGLHGNGYA